jgi:hypothetical protein
MKHLIEFNFQIIDIKGKTNFVADALSRTPKNAPSPEHQNHEILDKLIPKTTTIPLNSISQLEISADNLQNLRTEYSQDHDFTELLKLARPILPYTLQNGLLYRYNHLCVPSGPAL